MSDRERKQAFAVSALFIAAVVVVLSLTGPAGRDRRPAPVAAPPEIAEAPPTVAAAEPDVATPPSAELHAARDRAGAFVEALLQLEAGARSRRARRALRAGADAELARRLLARPPAGDGGQIVDVEHRGAAPGGGVLFVATIDRGGRTTTTLLTLRPERGDWVVTDVG